MAEATIAYETVNGGGFESSFSLTVENDSAHVGNTAIIVVGTRGNQSTFTMSGNINTWTEPISTYHQSGGDSIYVAVRTLTASDINDSITITPGSSANGIAYMAIFDDNLGTYEELAGSLNTWSSGTTSPSTSSATAPPSGGTTVICGVADSASAPNTHSKSGWSADTNASSETDYYSAGVLWLSDGASGSSISYTLSNGTAGGGANIVLSFNSPAGDAGSTGATTDTGGSIGGGPYDSGGVVDDQYLRNLQYGGVYRGAARIFTSQGDMVHSTLPNDGAPQIDAQIGEVSIDRRRSVRADSDLVIADPSNIPTTGNDTFGPLAGTSVQVMGGYQNRVYVPQSAMTQDGSYVFVPSLTDTGGNRIDSDESINLNTYGTTDMFIYLRCNLFKHGWGGDGEYLYGWTSGYVSVRHTVGILIFQMRLPDSGGAKYCTVQTASNELTRMFADHRDPAEADLPVFFRASMDVNVAANRIIEYTFQDTNDPDDVAEWVALETTYSTDTNTAWYNAAGSASLFHLDRGVTSASDGLGEVSFASVVTDPGTVLTRFCADDVSAWVGADGLNLPAKSGNYASSDTTPSSITGDFELHVTGYKPSSGATRWGISSLNATAGCAVGINSTGYPEVQWRDSGGALRTMTSTVAAATGKNAWYVTVDLDNGSSERVATFYENGSTLDTVTTAGASSLTAPTTGFRVGSNTFGTSNLWDTQIESAAAYAGIGGTRTDSPNFANQAVGTTSFDDDEGNTWTINQTVPADTNTHDDPDTAETWTFNIDATGELEWTYNSDRIGTELTLVDNFFNLGVFSLAEVATTHTEAGVEYQASLRDYAWQLNRKMGEHITVADGTNAGSMIESLIIGALPEIQFVADTTIYTLPTMAIEEDENRLDVIEQIAQSVGFEIWFDREGRCNIRSADAVVGNSLWTYGEGGFAAQNITRRFVDNGEIINGVIVDGEDLEDGLVVEGEFWDLDASSPTYYDPLTNAGTVGPRPDTLRNELIDTTQRANYAAFSHLIKVGTGPEYVDFECAPNPAMKLRDLIDLCDTAMGIDGQWEVVALSVPVGLGLQQVTARRQWDPSGGDAVVQA